MKSLEPQRPTGRAEKERDLGLPVPKPADGAASPLSLEMQQLFSHKTGEIPETFAKTSEAPTLQITKERQGIPYTVKFGDTLAAIAKAHQVAIPDILTFNPVFTSGQRHPSRLYPGDQILLPPPMALGSPAPSGSFRASDAPAVMQAADGNPPSSRHPAFWDPRLSDPAHEPPLLVSFQPAEVISGQTYLHAEQVKFLGDQINPATGRQESEGRYHILVFCPEGCQPYAVDPDYQMIPLDRTYDGVTKDGQASYEMPMWGGTFYTLRIEGLPETLYHGMPSDALSGLHRPADRSIGYEIHFKQKAAPDTAQPPALPPPPRPLSTPVSAASSTPVSAASSTPVSAASSTPVSAASSRSPAASSVPPAFPTTTGQTLYTTGHLNLRPSPTTQGNQPLGILPPHTSAEITPDPKTGETRRDGFLHVTAGDKQGWIAQAYVTDQPPAGLMLQTTGHLNLRSAPSTQGNQPLGVIPPKTAVQVTPDPATGQTKRDGFLHVSAKGKQGWLSEKHLGPTSATSPTAPALPPPSRSL